MSYKLYNIEGIVINSISVSESSSILYVLTEDLGLIRVWAQGIRKVNSKLAPHVQDLTQTRIVVVKGREYWRLTDAEKRKGYSSLLQEKSTRAVVIRLIQIIKRLAHEGVDKEVFTLTSNFLQHLENKKYDKIESEVFEIIYILRLLNILGYGINGHAKILKEPLEWSIEREKYVLKNRSLLIKSINEALKISQL